MSERTECFMRDLTPADFSTEMPTCRLRICNGVLQQEWVLTEWRPDTLVENVRHGPVAQIQVWRDVPQVTE